MTDKTTKNDDGSTTVVRETEETGVIEVTFDGMTDREMLEDALAQLSCLTAHLVTKGYGHNAIKRILKGEVVG